MYDYVWIQCKSYMPYMPSLQNIIKSDQAVQFNKWICTWLLWKSMMISSDQATSHNSAPYGKFMVRSFGSKGKAVELNKTWQNTMGEQLKTTVDGSEIRRLPVDMVQKYPVSIGFHTSQVVQDFFHQQYVASIGTFSRCDAWRWKMFFWMMDVERVLMNHEFPELFFLPQRLWDAVSQLNSFTKKSCENKSSCSATLLVQGAIDETCRLRRASLGKNLECLLSHEVAHLLGLCLVFLGDVVPAGIGGVVLAVGGQATWDAHAGAIELPHNPLLLLSWGSYWRGKDEVSSPPKWNWLRCQVQGRHHMGQVCLQEVFRQTLEEWFLWSVEGVDGTGSANCRDSSLLRFLVNDPDQGVADQIVAQLALHNTWTKTLVHKLATCFFATFQVLSDTFWGPFTGLVCSATHAELDEFSHSVFLLIIVVGLHEHQLLIILARPVTIVSAIVLSFQLDDPNALTWWATILLDDAWLECHGLLEANGELFRSVVRQSVFQANVHGCHFAQSILGTHLFHHVWWWPNLLSHFPQATHAIIKLLLVSSICLDLARVASNDDKVEALAKLEKLVMLLMCVVDQLAAHSRVDHAIPSWWFQPSWKIFSQNGNLPQIGVKIKNIWNHHPDSRCTWNRSDGHCCSCQSLHRADCARRFGPKHPWTLVHLVVPTCPCNPLQPRWCCYNPQDQGMILSCRPGFLQADLAATPSELPQFPLRGFGGEQKFRNQSFKRLFQKQKKHRKQTNGYKRHGGLCFPPPPEKQTNSRKATGLPSAREKGLFWSTNKTISWGAKRSFRPPKHAFLFVKGLFSPKLTNLCLHPSGLRGLALNQALVFGRCTTAHDCRRQLRA